MTPARTFDPAAPLPTGRVALEASAGTGKTYTIAALVARYVVEKEVPISGFLVVTFTKSAAAELRDRIRGRLTDLEHRLTSIVAGHPPGPSDDPFLSTVDRQDRATAQLWLMRVETALAEFDTATIGTIHSYAQALLAEQGLAALTDPDAELAEDLEGPLADAVADVITVHMLSGGSEVSAATVTAAARLMLQKPRVRLFPGPAERSELKPDSRRDLEEIAAVIEAVVERVRSTRRRASVLGFDDLLIEAERLVADPVLGPPAVEAVRSRIRVALIDEFQDTDAVQWGMLRRLFDAPGCTLITVGDPKQSIYRFRGADINSYLDSLTGAERYTLGTNFRSDPLFLRAADALFDGFTFGDGRIAFHRVEPSPVPPEPLERGDTVASGVEVRYAGDAGKSADFDRSSMAADLADQIVELLTAGTLPDRAGGRRPVRPGDIAVLVRSYMYAAPVERLLRRANVPVVTSSVGSVYLTEAASQLLTLLRAVAAPASRRRVRAAAVGWFLGLDWSAVDPYRPADPSFDLAALQMKLSAWADILATTGVSAFFDRVWHDGGLMEKLLTGPTGERNLTDLDHLRELLEGGGQVRNIHGLIEQLERSMTESSDDGDAEAAERRTDSDEDAVQLMSIHRSKGLEFPVVFVLGVHTKPTVRVPYAIDIPGDGRVVDFAPKAAMKGRSTWRGRAEQAEAGELRRLVYVAVTRAVHLCVLYCGPAADGPTAELLYGCPTAPSDGGPPPRLVSAGIRSGNVLRAVPYPASTIERRWQRRSGPEPVDLAVATIDRSFDRLARRWSFTRISGMRVQPQGYVEDGASVLLQETQPGPGAADEATPDGLTVDESDVDGSTLPLGDLPGGAAFGTMVHRILERTDFAHRDLSAELDRQVGDAVSWSNWATDRARLVAGLTAALDTPLGSMFDGRALRSFTFADRLDELSFEIPLAPGLAPASRPTPGDIGRLALDHLDPTDPLRSWAADLAGGAMNTRLAGHLTGSIDAVFRMGSADPRFVVVDYKTNRLGHLGVPLSGEDYRQEALVAAMIHHDYPLQALLYLVALHRYLRWRIGPEYRPESQLGGAAYLFVRGMTGANAPEGDGGSPGVFTWAVPPALIAAISDLLHRGEI